MLISLTFPFLCADTTQGGVMRAAEKHSHMGSMKVSFITAGTPRPACCCEAFWFLFARKWPCAFLPSCAYMSSQDFSMDFGHCPEITVYTGCCLFPPADQLAALWAENKKPLLSMLVEVRRTACSNTDRFFNRSFASLPFKTSSQFPVTAPSISCFIPPGPQRGARNSERRQWKADRRGGHRA